MNLRAHVWFALADTSGHPPIQTDFPPSQYDRPHILLLLLVVGLSSCV